MPSALARLIADVRRLNLPAIHFVPAAALAFGIAIGNWLIGPLVSYEADERVSLRSATAERQAIAAASARPDPSPYRTPTPDFGNGAAPRYGEIARQRARAGPGDGAPQNEAAIDAFESYEFPPDDTPRRRYPRFDRHMVR